MRRPRKRTSERIEPPPAHERFHHGNFRKYRTASPSNGALKVRRPPPSTALPAVILPVIGCIHSDGQLALRGRQVHRRRTAIGKVNQVLTARDCQAIPGRGQLARGPAGGEVDSHRAERVPHRPSRRLGVTHAHALTKEDRCPRGVVVGIHEQARCGHAGTTSRPTSGRRPPRRHGPYPAG